MLHGTEKKYRDLANSLPQVVAEIDIEGNMTFANLISLTIFGYTKEDFDKGLNIFQMIAPEEHERVRENFQKFIKGQKQDGSEYTGVRKDGSRFPFVSYLNPVLRENKTVGFRTLVIDITDRKQSDEALRISQSRLAEAMDLANIVYWEIDPADNAYIFNDPFYAFYGTTAEKEGGYRMTREEYFKRFVHPDDRSNISPIVAQRINTPEFEILPDLEHRIIRRDGEVRHILVRARVVKNKSGRIIKRYGANQDITKRKHAEEVLRESEGKFRDLAEKSVAGVYLVQDGMLKYVNLKLAQVLGYSIDEMIDKLTVEDVIFPEDWPIVEENYLKRISGEIASLHYEFRIVTKDRQVKNAEVYSSRTIYKGRPAVIGTMLDITERKLTEILLEEERQRFLVLADEAPFGIVLLNRENKLTYVNRKFRDIFGYNLHDIPDVRTWFRKVYPDAGYRHKVIETWLSNTEKNTQDASLTGEGEWIFTVTCKDNTEKTVSFIVLRLPTGEYLMTCEDITERKKTEAALEKREAELEMKSKNLEEMNAALKVLLKEREYDKIELEDRVLSNVRELVFPYIEKLKKSRLDSQYMTYVDIIETNLHGIVSPFLQKMGLKYANLTPTEIEIVNLIKSGKGTKEIGKLLHISSGTINFHRNNIRKKLGLNNEKVNLRSHLMSL